MTIKPPNHRVNRYRTVALLAPLITLVVLCVLWMRMASDDGPTSELAETGTRIAPSRVTEVEEAALCEAALEGLTQKVRTLLQQGVDANLTDDEGRTPLMLAAFNGHTHAVAELLKHGAAVDTLDPIGRTALIYAASGPNKDVVQLLLQNQADPDIVDKDEGFTALMFAAAEGQVQVVEVLLKHGADVDARDIDGDSAYDFAVKAGHAEVARLLTAAKTQ